MSSPFDEAALNQPFLQEKPIIKRLPNFASFLRTMEQNTVQEDEEKALLPFQIDGELVCPTETTHNMESFEIEHDLEAPTDMIDKDIQRMSWMAIDAFENTNSGLEKVVKAAQFSEKYQLNQRRKHVLVALLGLVVFVALARGVLMNDDQQESTTTADYTRSINAAKSALFHQLQNSHIPSLVP